MYELIAVHVFQRAEQLEDVRADVVVVKPAAASKSTCVTHGADAH